jgi:hypothetical protein
MPFYLDPEQDDTDNPVYCHGCGGHLGQYESLTPKDVVWWNGWPWCIDHGAEMQRLEKLPADAVDQVTR